MTQLNIKDAKSHVSAYDCRVKELEDAGIKKFLEDWEKVPKKR